MRDGEFSKGNGDGKRGWYKEYLGSTMNELHIGKLELSASVSNFV